MRNVVPVLDWSIAAVVPRHVIFGNVRAVDEQLSRVVWNVNFRLVRASVDGGIAIPVDFERISCTVTWHWWRGVADSK